MACDSGAVFCCDRYCKRCELYRWPGWTGFQRDFDRSCIFTVVSIGTKSGIEPVTGAVVGGLMGFLLFNVYPAKVFMGDTGSLALGGFVAGAAYMMQMPLFILLIGLILSGRSTFCHDSGNLF